MAQRLRRVEARRLARRVDGRDEADQHRRRHHQRDVARHDREGQVRQLVDVGRDLDQVRAIEQRRRGDPRRVSVAAPRRELTIEAAR